MVIHLRYSHFLYFTVFLTITHLVVCGDKLVDAKEKVSKLSATTSVKIDSPTTLNKEEEPTTISINVTSTLTTKKNAKDDIKTSATNASENINEKKEESIPEKVEPKKPAKIPPVIPSAVNPPKAKMDKFTKDQVQNAHYGTTLLIFLVLLFLIYCILQNKNRIMGLIVEGRGGRPNGRRGASVRYRRLNTDDAEAGIQ